MTKQKKQTFLLGSLILLLILLGVSYSFIKKINIIKEEEGKQAIELYRLDTKKAEKVIFSNESGTVELVKNNSNWSLNGEPKFPVNSEKVESILNLVKVVNANSEVTDGTEELGQYGLDNPISSIYIELNNGVKAKVSFGSKVPVLGGYYCLIDDETKVYTMGEDLYQAIGLSKMDFVKMEQIPTIESKKVKKLEIVKSSQKAITIVKKADGSFSLEGVYDSDVTGNGEAILSLFEKLEELSFENCIEYACKDFSKYGLKAPKKSIKVSYMVKENSKNIKNQYVLYVGNQREDGSYYVTPKGSSYVYTINESMIDELLNQKAFDYIDKTVFAFSTDTLKSIIVKDKAGNKKTMTVKKDLDTLNALQALNFTGEVEKQVVERVPEYTCTIQNDGKKSILSFFPYDGKKYYFVKKDGRQLYLVDKNVVDELLEHKN